MKNLTVSTVVKALTDFLFTAGQIGKAVRAVITCRTGGVMYTYDGATDPTAAIGHLCAVNATVEVFGKQNIYALRFLREAGTDASVTITLEEF